ncbi:MULTISPECIES: GNAT family N-acetyltransferase [Luteimonas]|uniref:GNAT family N-acetyltransferase n=1 Tax=Luteimonas TaxID=83614 RepID=UPI000C7A09A5|nr:MULTISPECIES: GNAT family protein [Luteimonas]
MSSAPALLVRPASPGDAAAAKRLVLTPEQVVYAGDLAFQIDNARAAPDSDAMVVRVGDRVIGFYRLDYLQTVDARRNVDRSTVTLRSFALDLAWQGRGLGRAALAACCLDLALRHPERSRLALNVHVRNTVARRVYRRAGFVETGTSLTGGSAGPQCLLLRPLGMGQWPP